MDLYFFTRGGYFVGNVTAEDFITISLGSLLCKGLNETVYEGERPLGFNNGMNVFCQDLDNECCIAGDMIEVHVDDLTAVRNVAIKLIADDYLSDFKVALGKVVEIFNLAIEKATLPKACSCASGDLVLFRWL